MDVISITAAVIQLLGVSGACAKKLRKLIHTTKHAPDEILAISNEISDLYLILSDLESLTRAEESITLPDHLGVPEPDFNRSISNQLNKAKAKLGDLQSLVNELCTTLPNGSLKFQRMAWTRKKGLAIALQQDLVNIKGTLKLILDAKNA
jgi:hypothetical protein